jgi:hypothetical protein
MLPKLKQCIRHALDGKRPDYPIALAGMAERKGCDHNAAQHQAVQHGGGVLGALGLAVSFILK